jgi:hypothetical protein
MYMRIIKIADCCKVTSPDNPTLTYNIGVDDSDSTYLRVTDNATGGLFSTEWIAVADVLSTIAKLPKTKTNFNARIFAGLFKSQSANNAGFLTAVLKAEGILLPHKESKRLHEMGDVAAFESSMQKLIKDKVNLPDVVAERAAVKAKVQAENAAKLAANRAKNTAVKRPSVKSTKK